MSTAALYCPNVTIVAPRHAGREHDLSILSETREILRNLLELIDGEDERHFKAMAALVTPPALAPAAAVP